MQQQSHEMFTKASLQGCQQVSSSNRCCTNKNTSSCLHAKQEAMCGTFGLK